MKKLGQFLAPDMTPERSISIKAQSSTEGKTIKTSDVIRGFNLCHIPPENMLEQLNPVLAREKEEMETEQLMPLVEQEIMSINWKDIVRGDKQAQGAKRGQVHSQETELEHLIEQEQEMFVDEESPGMEDPPKNAMEIDGEN